VTIVDVSREHIEIVEGASGPKARIAGHNIRVADIVQWYEQQGMSAAEIVEHFPTITRADVHAALAYYWDHKEELDRKMAEDAAFVEETFRNHASPLQDILKRLDAEKQQRVG
jgi:uncharacterized protein (DUF433 family)